MTPAYTVTSHYIKKVIGLELLAAYITLSDVDSDCFSFILVLEDLTKFLSPSLAGLILNGCEIIIENIVVTIHYKIRQVYMSHLQ